MNFKTKIRPNDKLWTEYIRLRDKGICQYCGKKIESKYNSGVSHYHGRAKESTRYEDNNCHLMCNIPCHKYLEHEKKVKGIKSEYDGDYTIWLKKKIGEEEFDRLYLQAHTTKKRDDEMDKLYIKAKIKRLEV